jgi:hypothetical protein
MAWLSEMASHTRSAAPSQLVFSSTEGFFDKGSECRRCRAPAGCCLLLVVALWG